MVKNKTTETAIRVADFIDSYVDDPQKKADSFRLIELMTEWSGFAPKMWGGEHHRVWQLSLPLCQRTGRRCPVNRVFASKSCIFTLCAFAR